jgi:hypothetical protein
MRMVGSRFIMMTMVMTLVVGFGSSTGSAAAGEFKLATPPFFGSEGVGAGDFGVGSPRSVAVNALTGDVYVLDNSNLRVEKFSANGEYISAFTGNETPAGVFTAGAAGLAVDNSGGSPNSGDVYLADRENGVVDRFEASGKYTGFQLSGLVEPDAVAVDSEGDIYVTEPERKGVREFGPEGEPTAEFDSENLTEPFGVAVDSKGDLYIVNNKSNIVELKRGAGGKVVSESIIDTHEPTAVAVDPVTDDVFVVNDEGEANVAIYNSAGKQVGEFGATQIGFARGLAFSPFNDDIYVADRVNTRVAIYEGEAPPPPPPPPVPVTGSVVTLGRTSVTLSGSVNPEGEEAKWFVEYGPCLMLSACAASPYDSRTVEGIVGEKKEVVPVATEEHVDGLAPGSIYHARLRAEDSNGSEAGEEIIFTTLPAVAGVSSCTGKLSTGVDGTLSAVLVGSLEPEDEVVEYFFEYGLTTSYEEPPTEHHATSAPAIQSAEAKIGSLLPNATYDCRLVTERSIEGFPYTTDGENGTFETTRATPAVNDQPPSTSSITRRAAVLHGTLDPENSATKYHFVYVSDSVYQAAKNAGAPNPYSNGVSTPEESAGSGVADEEVQSSQLTGLRPGTTYDYALVATNGAGTAVGLNHQFTTLATPPLVGSGSANSVTATSAIVTETVDPFGVPASYEFEFGTDATYSGAKMFGQVAPGEETIALELEDLAPDTTYHYRIVATSEDGTVAGPDGTFTTLGVPSPIMQPSAPPLLATPAIVFPKVTGKVLKPPPKKKARKSSKRGRAKHKSKRRPPHKK